MSKSGLILEGGGMRGVYTTGVLDYFLEKNLEFDNYYGVSAGSCHACSFLSQQKGRGFSVCIDYLTDSRCVGIKSLRKTGDIFGAKMLYEIIPKELNIFDYETFKKHKGNFYAVVTNCRTGKAEYKLIKDLEEDMIYIRASSSLPLLSRIVRIGTKKYLDGGVSDSIPIKRSIEDGNTKNVIILTRDETYKKTSNKLMSIMKIKYKDYPELLESIKTRHIVYNDILEFIQNEEKKGNIFVIRPKEIVKVGRLEKNKEKLTKLYKIGYEDAKENYEKLIEYLKC